jgi:hypothetical protein
MLQGSNCFRSPIRKRPLYRGRNDRPQDPTDSFRASRRSRPSASGRGSSTGPCCRSRSRAPCLSVLTPRPPFRAMSTGDYESVRPTACPDGHACVVLVVFELLITGPVFPRLSGTRRKPGGSRIGIWVRIFHAGPGSNGWSRRRTKFLAIHCRSPRALPKVDSRRSAPGRC